nr:MULTISPECIES: VCBS repeat-containing protein [Myxococcaceae]
MIGCGALEACVDVDNSPPPPDPAAGLSCNTGALGSSFDLAATTFPRNVVVADLNGDGRPDVAGIGGYGVSVWLNQGGGAFAPEVVYALSFGRELAAADVNGDGRVDLVGTGRDTSARAAVGVLLNRGSGAFNAPVLYTVGDSSGGEPPRRLIATDRTGDGRPDLVMLRNSDNAYPDGALTLMTNSGSGTFSVSANVTGPGLYDLDAADLNADGKADVVVSTGQGVGVYLTQANGALGARVDSGSPTVSLVRIADVNGDGKPDVVAPTSDTTQVLLNPGTGVFGAAKLTSQSFAAQNMVAADVNGDAKPDLVGFLPGQPGSILISLGRGDGSFAGVTVYGSTTTSAAGLAVADLTGDGKRDVVVTTDPNGVAVITNACP